MVLSPWKQLDQLHQRSHLGLLSCDAVYSEASLHIVDQTEVLAGLINADNICVNRKHILFIVV